MKKKILAILFAIILLIPCLTLTVSADNLDISLSGDFKTLKHNGIIYSRFDSSMIEWENDRYYNGVTYNIADVKYVDYNISVNDVIITADIYLTDGTSVHATYIDENYLLEHNTLMYNPTFYEVEFESVNKHTVAVSAQHFNSNKTTISSDKIEYSECFPVNAPCSDGSFYVKKGILALIDDEYYYISYIENNCKSTFELLSNENLVLLAHKVTDADTVARLNSAYNELSSGSLSLFNGDFSVGIGTVLLVFAFGIIPLAALILFLILALRAKTPSYKKMFTAIWITSLSELVLFAAAVILFLVSK